MKLVFLELKKITFLKIIKIYHHYFLFLQSNPRLRC